MPPLGLTRVFGCAVFFGTAVAVAVSGQTAGGSTPRDRRVLSATSADGGTWTCDEGVQLIRASVPCAINDGDRRELLYVVRPPDKAGGGVSSASAEDGTSFRLEAGLRIEGRSMLSAVAPSVVRDAVGTFRLHTLASNSRGDPAPEPNPHCINLALPGQRQDSAEPDVAHRPPALRARGFQPESHTAG